MQWRPVDRCRRVVEVPRSRRGTPVPRPRVRLLGRGRPPCHTPRPRLGGQETLLGISLEAPTYWQKLPTNRGRMIEVTLAPTSQPCRLNCRCR
jgi:hypothetical protein